MSDSTGKYDPFEALGYRKANTRTDEPLTAVNPEPIGCQSGSSSGSRTPGCPGQALEEPSLKRCKTLWEKWTAFKRSPRKNPEKPLLRTSTQKEAIYGLEMEKTLIRIESRNGRIEARNGCLDCSGDIAAFDEKTLTGRTKVFRFCTGCGVVVSEHPRRGK